MLKKSIYIVMVCGFLMSAAPSFATSCAIWLKQGEHSRYYEPQSSILNIGNSLKEVIDKEFRKRHLPMYYQCGVSEYLYEMFVAKNIAYEEGKKFEWHSQKVLKSNEHEKILRQTYTCAFQCFD